MKILNIECLSPQPQKQQMLGVLFGHKHIHVAFIVAISLWHSFFVLAYLMTKTVLITPVPFIFGR